MCYYGEENQIMERGYSADPDEGYPAVQLAKILEKSCILLYGQPVIRPPLLQIIIEKHWSKISMLAHKIHNEETK